MRSVLAALAWSWSCDRSANFIPGLSYSQISLTDDCPACDANPRYCSGVGCNDLERAIVYCKERCEEQSSCKGFFFQTHTNGHEICGFFTGDMHSAERAWHGHKNGAVCELAAET